MLKDVHEFSLSDKNIRKAIKKEKNWTAPRADGIENFGLKLFAATWKPLSWAMNEWIRDQTTLLEWLEIGQTVLLPQTEHLSSNKDYWPITCFNIGYKLFAGTFGKYMKEYAVRNDMWYKNQMLTSSDDLRTIDQLLIDDAS